MPKDIKSNFMTTIKFSVQGSSVEPYEVTFHFDGNNCHALCTCQAGKNGQLCKHRENVLKGSTSGIVSNNHVEVNQIKQLFKGTLLESKFTQFAEEESQLEMLKKKIATTKKELTRIMNGK